MQNRLHLIVSSIPQRWWFCKLIIWHDYAHLYIFCTVQYMLFVSENPIFHIHISRSTCLHSLDFHWPCWYSSQSLCRLWVVTVGVFYGIIATLLYFVVICLLEIGIIEYCSILFWGDFCEGISIYSLKKYLGLGNGMFIMSYW